MFKSSLKRDIVLVLLVKVAILTSIKPSGSMHPAFPRTVRCALPTICLIRGLKPRGRAEMISESVVDLSRLQFAMTAMYHFLFVPLTLGLAFLLAIMESVYVMTGKQVYKDMTQFWGKLFGINFALGVTTG